MIFFSILILTKCVGREIFETLHFMCNIVSYVIRYVRHGIRLVWFFPSCHFSLTKFYLTPAKHLTKWRDSYLRCSWIQTHKECTATRSTIPSSDLTAFRYRLFSSDRHSWFFKFYAQRATAMKMCWNESSSTRGCRRDCWRNHSDGELFLPFKVWSPIVFGNWASQVRNPFLYHLQTI